MRILAVDDDMFVLELVRLFLMEAGYRDVVPVRSGIDALEALTAHGEGFDCLLLDISMPGMDGIELCARVREMPAYRKTPIIMLTAMTEKRYIDRAFRAGATDYVTKPLDVVELGARLRVAEEIVDAQKRAEAALAAAERQGAGSSYQPPIVFDREVPITGVKDLLEYTALGNYLLQLSRSNLDGMQVVAVTIHQAEQHFERSSAREFMQMLTDVGGAISQVFRAHDCALAYQGSGNFVVVFYKDGMEPSTAFEKGVQVLVDKRVTEEGGTAGDVLISISNPIRPNPGKNQRIRKTFDRAIARARAKSDRKELAKVKSG